MINIDIAEESDTTMVINIPNAGPIKKTLKQAILIDHSGALVKSVIKLKLQMTY